MTAQGPTRPGRGRPAGATARRAAAAPTRARLLALRVLLRVERAGAYADLALRAALGRAALAPADRALATELVYGTLRWRGRLDFLLSFVLDRDFGKLEPRIATILRLGAYQLARTERIPASSAVDQSVRLARAVGAERAAGFVNAVLRRLAGQVAEIPLPRLEDDPLGHLTHALSLPSWLAERWLALHGPAEAAELAGALAEVPPLVVRANPQRTTRGALLAELRTRRPGAEPTRFAPLGVRLGHGGDPGSEPAFLAGRFTVQDEGSQLVVELLDPQPGERVLDACAAPGTKATAIAERVGPEGRVLALDRSARRLRLVPRDARRLGLANLAVAAADATRALGAWAPPASFDRVLVDAPCSGLGALRRNPDARWRLRPEDPARLAAIQAAILGRAASALRPGGTLVYSTCTLLPEENELVVEAFLAQSPEFRATPPSELPACVRPLLSPDGFMRALPHRHDTDGFFAARLERRP
jgi:16S rRNA (cytosine967-C5)-methyltransferase